MWTSACRLQIKVVIFFLNILKIQIFIAIKNNTEFGSETQIQMKLNQVEMHHGVQ